MRNKDWKQIKNIMLDLIHHNISIVNAIKAIEYMEEEEDEILKRLQAIRTNKEMNPAEKLKSYYLFDINKK